MKKYKSAICTLLKIELNEKKKKMLQVHTYYQQIKSYLFIHPERHITHNQFS